MEDRDIVDLYWQRSMDAISETEIKYGRYCRSITENICKNSSDAEGCVNDTYLSAWNSMPDKLVMSYSRRRICKYIGSRRREPACNFVL